jgi:hypothetical protein
VHDPTSTLVEGGIMALDAWSRKREMPTSTEMRRRTAAALGRALEASPEVANPTTRAALRAHVDVLVREGLTPEAVLIAFKETLARAQSLQRFEPELREQIRASLISECIERYFLASTPDDLRATITPRLEIVRDERSSDRPRPPDGAP